MLNLTDKPLKRLKSRASMFHAKENASITASITVGIILVTGKERNQYLIRLKEIISINHFQPSLNTKEDNVEFVLDKDVMHYSINKSNLVVFALCV